MMYRLLWLLMFAALAVAAALTLNRVQDSRRAVQPGTPAAPGPGYSARDADIVETGPDGAPMYSLHAHTIRQQPQTDLVDLDQVRLDFRDQDGGSWTARADHGVVQTDSSQVRLAGAVDVSGTFAGTDQPAHILTDTLDVDTQAGLIHTPSPVVLDWAGKLVHARGLSANLKDHRVKLEADVRGHFEP